MTQADQIRRFILDNYIQPARMAGTDVVTVRAGDVHRDMGLSNAMPSVCQALDGKKFAELGKGSARDTCIIT
jgi:5-methylcytosine-specific restriction enzyme B